MIMVDNRYYAGALHTARRDIRMQRAELARQLGITKHKLHKYETGREVMPTDLLVKIMSAGMFVFRK